MGERKLKGEWLSSVGLAISVPRIGTPGTLAEPEGVGTTDLAAMERRLATDALSDSLT